MVAISTRHGWHHGGVIRRVLPRLLVTGVMMVLMLGGMLAPGQASAATPTTLEMQLERPVWKLKERMVVSGHLVAGDQPLGGAPVHVGVDGYLDDTLYRTITAPDGTYRLEFWVEDWWGFGGHSLTAFFPGTEEHAESSTSTIFQVAPDQVAPVALTVDPAPGPVAPGQQIRLTGALRNDRNEPAVGHSVLAVIDPATEARAFGKVGEDGTWALKFTVPTTPGQWSATFPEYRVPVMFEGDWWLAPAQVDVVLTLTHVPADPTPTPATPAPSPVPRTQSPTPVPTARPSLVSMPVPNPGPLPAWMPRWVASPVFLLSTGAFLAVLVGATFVSHGRRGE
jgi:hypothetical protein